MISFESHVNGISHAEPEPEPPSASVPKVLKRPADRVRELAQLGPVLHLETGIPTLDKSSRGGLPSRRLVVLGGAPGAGKTTLAVAWGWRWSKAGFVVGMLAVDEGPEGTFSRIGQLEGISAERIEEREPLTMEHLAATLDATPLIVTDGDEDAGTVEGVAALVAARAEGRPAVLIVDSIQTVRAYGTDEAEGPRARVDAVVRALKSVRDRHGLLVIATCELARGAYRSRSLAETINDLAAFKESGAVEYAAQTALVLRSVPDEASLVDVTVPKNRAYRREPFRLRIDHETTAVTEVDLPDAPEGRRAVTNHLDRDVAELRKLLVERPGINGLRAVRDSLRARGAAMSNDRVGAAMVWLRDAGELDNRGTDHRPEFHLRQASNDGGNSDV